MIQDAPTISSSTYTSSGVGECFVADAATMHVPGGTIGHGGFSNQAGARINLTSIGHGTGITFTQTGDFMDSMRLLRVILIDPDEKLPMERRVLKSVSEHWTVLNDQELYHELEVAAALREHNNLRDQHKLKPIRIRDLVMQVITAATVALKTSD